MVTRELNISLVGRVEGDLDVNVYLENGVVTRAHTQASMFWGFEKILQGKEPIKCFGASEAVRGALAHWIEIENGLIKNCQIVAPTTWNIGPQDDKGNPGTVDRPDRPGN